MSFDGAQLVTLGDMAEMDPVALDNWLTTLPPTADIETAIKADIVFWNANLANAAGVSIEPKERNFGGRINGDELRDAIILRTKRRLRIITSSSNSNGHIGTIEIGTC